MAIKDVNPSYADMEPKWRLGRDSYQGEDAIKAATTEYLPPTSGQIEDGQGQGGNNIGERAYSAYLQRAYYPDIYMEAVEAAVGLLHREPPKIDLPTGMEGMREDCTLLGESLEMFLRRVNARQLITGRVGILGDIRPDDQGDRPVLVLYHELAVRNWDDTSEQGQDRDIRMVVLDESCYAMNTEFKWEWKTCYRVCALCGNNGELFEGNFYGTKVLGEKDSLSGLVLDTPNIRGSKLEGVPFTFVNTKDLSPDPDNLPLQGLANLCLAIYRGEADYRQNLFMQSQDTLVLIGNTGSGDESEEVRTGAGASINVGLNGDAKYIGVSSAGLSEQRTALENDYKRAQQKSGQLSDATSKAKESGEALRIRIAAQTATLPHIAKTGAAALEKILKDLARWKGLNEEDVSVTPNTNFSEADLNGQTLVQLMQSKNLGAPISDESVHQWMQDQGFTKVTFEDELERINSESPAPGSNIPSSADS